MNIYTHDQSPSSSLIYQLEQITTTQYEKYLRDVFGDASRAIYVEIKHSNIKLFPGKNIRKDKTKVKLQSVQTCNKLVTNLFIASQQRDADLDDLFQYEISFPPPSLLSGDEVNKSKSSLIDCFVKKYRFPNQRRLLCNIDRWLFHCTTTQA